MDQFPLNPQLREFKEFFDEFKGESDRAAVILGAARLDTLLDQLLKMYLLPSTSSEDELFDTERPLASFHAKIMVAYRLGLIDATFVKALNLVRKIRNIFAHEGAGCDLNKGSTRDRIKELRKLFGHAEKYKASRKLFFGEGETPSVEFRHALAVLTLRLEGAVDSIERIEPKKRPWDIVPPPWEEKE